VWNLFLSLSFCLLGVGVEIEAIHFPFQDLIVYLMKKRILKNNQILLFFVYSSLNFSPGD
jgi:hypothetical protein